MVGLWSSWGELDPSEESTLSWVLAWAAVTEAHRIEVREGLLLSLSDLASFGRAPAGVVELVTSAIAPDDLHVAEVELYEVLVAARSRPVPVEPGAGEPIGPGPCLDLVRHLSSPIPLQRRLGAALVGARVGAGGLDDDEARTLAAVLAWALDVETAGARPALLAASLVLADRIAG